MIKLQRLDFSISDVKCGLMNSTDELSPSFTSPGHHVEYLWNTDIPCIGWATNLLTDIVWWNCHYSGTTFWTWVMSWVATATSKPSSTGVTIAIWVGERKRSCYLPLWQWQCWTTQHMTPVCVLFIDVNQLCISSNFCVKVFIQTTNNILDSLPGFAYDSLNDE